MNILFVTNQIGASANGGLFIQAKQTAKGLRALNNKVALHNAWDCTDLKKFDVVHIFGAGVGTYHFARELYSQGIPFVLSPVFYSTHSPKKIRLAQSLLSSFRKMIIGTWTDFEFVRAMCVWAKAVFPNTNEESELLQQAFSIQAGKIIVIPNGVDERFVTASPTEFLEKYGVENFVLNVGYWAERKNTLRLLRVINNLGVAAVFIGRKVNDEYGNLCENELKKSRSILSIEEIVNDSTLLSSAYAASTTFVLPSLYETPGISALEAGLAGSTIAITKYGGTREYFSDYVEYIEPSSEQSIETAILRSMQQQKNNSLRDHILNNYTWGVVAKKTEEAYSRIFP